MKLGKSNEPQGRIQGGQSGHGPPFDIYTESGPPILSWSEFKFVILRKPDGNKLFIALYIKTTCNNWKEVICLRFSKPNLTKKYAGV